MNLKKIISQVILPGPPGSGKTYLTEQVIKPVARSDDIIRYRLSILKGNNTPQGWPAVWDIVQFHPSYSYEDFVRTLVTVPTEAGITFEGQNRCLAKAARVAQESSPTPMLLILDEINRADIARILGKLTYVLERDRRGQPVRSQYGVSEPAERFGDPPTANTLVFPSLASCLHVTVVV